jgi:hypothetical protein
MSPTLITQNPNTHTHTPSSSSTPPSTPTQDDPTTRCQGWSCCDRLHLHHLLCCDRRRSGACRSYHHHRTPDTRCSCHRSSGNSHATCQVRLAGPTCVALPTRTDPNLGRWTTTLPPCIRPTSSIPTSARGEHPVVDNCGMAPTAGRPTFPCQLKRYRRCACEPTNPPTHQMHPLPKRRHDTTHNTVPPPTGDCIATSSCKQAATHCANQCVPSGGTHTEEATVGSNRMQLSRV